jgi:hypothetical protein
MTMVAPIKHALVTTPRAFPFSLILLYFAQAVRNGHFLESATKYRRVMRNVLPTVDRNPIESSSLSGEEQPEQNSSC